MIEPAEPSRTKQDLYVCCFWESFRGKIYKGNIETSVIKKRTATDKKRMKRTETDRNGQLQKETERNGWKQRETVRT